MAQQIPFLAQVAAIAPKLRIITGVVLLPLHKPLDLAEQLATLDVMSGGKLIFGAGVGYREVEFRAFGTTLKQAGLRFEENLTAIKRLFPEDTVTMTGSQFHWLRLPVPSALSSDLCRRSGSVPTLISG